MPEPVTTAAAASSIPSWVGPAISAGGSILGGLLGRADSNKLFKKQYRAQKEFAQNALGWKIKDARAHGISPLVALGASTSSPSFSMTGSGMGDALVGATDAIAGGLNASQQKKMQAVREAREVRLTDAQVRALEAQTRQTNTQTDLALAQHEASVLARAAARQTPGTYSTEEVAPATAETVQERQQMAAPTREPFSIGLGPVGTFTWKSSGRTSPGEAWEGRYSEIGGNIGATVGFLDDLYHNTGEQWYKWLADKLRSHIAEGKTKSFEQPIAP